MGHDSGRNDIRSRPQRLRDRAVHGLRNSAHRRRTPPHPRLLASLQLSGFGDDLPAGQSPAQGAAAARADQEPPAGPLGIEPRTCRSSIRSPESLHQEIRPRHDLHGRPGPRRAGRARARVSGRHLLRSLPAQERRRSRACASSSRNSPSPAESAATARPRRRARFTKAANWATCCRMPAARRSTARS